MSLTIVISLVLPMSLCSQEALRLSSAWDIISDVNVANQTTLKISFPAYKSMKNTLGCGDLAIGKDDITDLLDLSKR